MTLNELNFNYRKRKFDAISSDHEINDEFQKKILSKNEDEILAGAFPEGFLSSLTNCEKSKLYAFMKWLGNKLEIINGHESNIFQTSFN
jgi:hypothetical protein